MASLTFYLATQALSSCTYSYIAQVRYIKKGAVLMVQSVSSTLRNLCLMVQNAVSHTYSGSSTLWDLVD